MEKYFNNFSVIVSIVTGALCNMLGGWDILLSTLVAFIVIDYILGILKSIYNKKLSSEIGYKGIIKKVVILLVIATSYKIQQVIGSEIAIRDITTMFFLTNEGISILENASEFVPIPKQLKDVLVQLRKDDDK